jgi:orotate phosphoribosyltransferase
LIAEMTARMLLEVEAVHFRADEPFRFTSGWASPVYIDCRKLISYPRLRNSLMDFAASTIQSEIGFDSLDAIAGGETAGIPFAAWIADRMFMPMQYVRKKPKGFGRDAQIEGHFVEGSRVLLVEDLTTDGRSKVKFCNAMRKSGLVVEHAFVVFHYDIFAETKALLDANNIKMHALATWWDILRVARHTDFFDKDTLTEVESFLNNPMKWSSLHGGISTMPPN